MKRIYYVAILSIFTFSTVGVISDSYSCGMKEMKNKMCCTRSCCKHEVKLLKLSDNFDAPASYSLTKAFSTSIDPINSKISENIILFSFFHFSDTGHSLPSVLIDRLAMIQSFLI